MTTRTKDTLDNDGIMIPYLLIKCETGEVSKPLRAYRAWPFLADDTAIVQIADRRVDFREDRYVVRAVTPGECPAELRRWAVG